MLFYGHCLLCKLNINFFPTYSIKESGQEKFFRDIFFQSGFIFLLNIIMKTYEDVSLYDPTSIKVSTRFPNMDKYYFLNYFKAQTSKEMPNI